MSRLTVAQRIRIVRLAFQAECAVLNKAHLVRMATYAVMPLDYRWLPESVHACEDIGRRALHELLAEEQASSHA